MNGKYFSKAVRVDFSGLRKLKALVDQGKANPPAGPIAGMFKQWGIRYLTFVKRRYWRLARSGGGGEWPKLSPATIAKRRKGKGGSFRVDRTKRDGTTGRYIGAKEAAENPSILIDTGILVAALDIGNPGNLFQGIPNGVRVGFSGGRNHPDGHMTIAELAEIHNLGTSKIPQRAILVAPDQDTINAMMGDAERAVDKMLKAAKTPAPKGGPNGS